MPLSKNGVASENLPSYLSSVHLAQILNKIYHWVLTCF